VVCVDEKPVALHNEVLSTARLKKQTCVILFLANASKWRRT